jgi:hypothetical protein
MILSEQEREDILKKYSDNTSDEVLRHLRRNFPIGKPTIDIGGFSPNMITVGDKSYWIEGNKKLLVNKIFGFIEDRFNDIDKPTIRRTVKKYLDFFR